MEDRRASREQCRILADRLMVEYAGAVPPGQVLAAVFRAHHGLIHHADLTPAARIAICESSARRALTDSAARRPRALAG